MPAYVIFQNATLREIAIARPDSLSALSRVSGVGAKKLESYGRLILERLAALDTGVVRLSQPA